MASTIEPLKHLQISLEDVVRATNNFDENYLIGGGDFGKVYRGQLSLSGETVNIAARRLDRKHRQGSVEFWTEISMLASLKHENIISLIGFCDENGENIIITKDEATKGSLSMYLNNPTRLTWIQRLKICIGVARALDYIHNGGGRGYSIVHRNINSFTILLDDNLEAKLSGFEYSIKQSVDRMDLVVLSEAIGTKGYMDPEILKKGGVSHKSDIYSFGVVLCEILCGRTAYNPDVDDRFVAPLFRNHYGKKSLNDIIPLDLRYQMSRRSLTRFSEAAYSCLNENRLERPQMNDIVVELEKLLELENFIINKLEHLKIPLSDITLATKNFSKACHIKVNNYYNFYRAKLEHFDEENSPSIKEGKNKREFPRRRSIVVIKRLLPREDERGEEVFYTEIKMLHTSKHPNIVKVLGFCDEISEMILVVEHLANGYLYDYWTHISHMPILTWEKRLKICLDVANALNYLHTEMHDQKMILHRDVNSNCIALDENWVAKFIDFPISVLVPLNQIYEAREYRLGFFCYEDPVIMSDRRFFKRESDVYSFGVILFEFLCGRLAHDTIYRKEHNLGLGFVARRHFQDGKLPLEMIDPILKEESGENNFILKKGVNRYSLEKFVKIAYKCIAETQDQRPTMKVVVRELQKALFSQEQLQPLEMVHAGDKVEESIELTLTRQKLEDETQRPNMVQDVDELKKSMEIKFINANSIKKLEHLKIPLSDIKLATQNFSEEFLIRHPGYYNLYNAKLELSDEENSSIKEGKNKGKLPRRRVIINRFLPSQAQMFEKEFKILVTCKHPNIVKLIGFCNEDSEMILVVEYLSNEYLYDYLIYTNRPNLTWAQRLKICLDVSNALNYLHYEMEDGQSVVHRDIRINNIALDKDWGAKIVNFGYSLFQPSNQDDEALYDETDVHMDPKYIETRKLTRESDVYSFGVLLFEVLCGRLANDKIYLKESNKGLAFVAQRRFREGTLMGMIDHILMDVTDEKSLILKKGPNKASLDKFVKIALKCIAETQDQRPTMKVVAKELHEALVFNMENKDDLIMSLDDIKLATENFHDKNCIGRGGFGNVYKGKLPQGEGFKTIVAKRLDTKHGQGEHQFRTELQILFEYKHENLIPIVGYCDEKNEQIIVYEYASRGSLDSYLKDDVHLTWVKRLNICIDVATALAFLHGGAGKQAIVIHRDIKTANILLNDEWNAMLADFGLSLISPINQETDYVIDHVCGTRGYLDPVYLKSGFLTKESDIYSFGVVLFEMMCGESTYEIFNHKGQYLPGFIKESFEKRKHEDLVFEVLKKKIVPKALTAFQAIAYRCLHDDREKRPTAKEVLKQLKEALELQEDETQHSKMVQDVDELKSSMELKLINGNTIDKLEHLKIPLSDIKLATQNFSKEFQIRHPGYYNLYNAKLELSDEENPSVKEGKNKGKLPRRRVIINRFLPSQAQMFDKEFKILVTCKHPSIVKLLGFCNEDSEMILVVEYLSNEYLYDFLIYRSRPNLTWAQRLKICLDVSNALNYLHYEMEDGQSVVHRDIRINNIALDKDLGAKIVNFGYSVFQPSNKDDEALYDKTDVHMDPKYIETGKLTRESDVYSFGVLLFEVLCGRLANDKIYLKESNQGLAFVARRCFPDGTLMGMIDPILMEVTDEKSLILKKGPNKASLDKFVKIALKCIAETQDQRPTMKVVAKELHEALVFNMENKDDLIMSLEDIKLATENFHDKNCIGRGGFGNVYKGKLPQGEGFKTIVAKRLDTKHGQGEHQFRTELQILFEYKHENLIPIVGYCDDHEKNEQIIVYEYASRGSLDRYLKDDVHLTWVKRLNICIDVATALAFLHGGAGKQAIVIHRDIKTANILLNDEWNAMLADFGLSLISPINQETDYVIDHVCGTGGYLDPVYLKSGFLTKESDIYSFGVVLFEMMCGKSTYEIFNHKGQYLPGFIKESFEKGKHEDLVFEALKKKIVPKALTTFQIIAYRCLHDDRAKRPAAKEVLKQLKEALELQEKQLHPLNMMHIADEVEESMEHKLTRENSVDETQHSEMVQDVDELKRSMELKLINANSYSFQVHKLDVANDCNMDPFSKLWSLGFIVAALIALCSSYAIAWHYA
uniref:uncharacterized protein LOC122599677 isoform X2 n=1 Tax=Erigeron canadensis TaxID=72917 RepID=UPI001CB99B8C|nr:uncharacterized protein LOC122599677 isoform X2 [Erigeron canadensis]